MNADYQATISPFINVVFYVTSVWWEQPRNHRGLDIATSRNLGNVPLYSMCDGTVEYIGYDADGYGHYIIMKDSTTNMGFLYGHLHARPTLSVGQSIGIGEYVGLEGTSGSSTGIHLHLEMQDLTNHDWIYQAPQNVYTNPATFMGIPNEEGISVYYDGTPVNPPSTRRKRKGYNFVLFNRRRRYG